MTDVHWRIMASGDYLRFLSTIMRSRLWTSVIVGTSVLGMGGAVVAQRTLHDQASVLAQNTTAGTTAGQLGANQTQAIESRDFLDRIGVNTHIHYTDGGYANVEKVIDALKFVGISNLRDSVPDRSLPGGGGYHFDKFADAGFKFDFVVSPNLPLAKTLSMLETFAEAHPDAITAIEGPNEVNNWPVTYNGETGPKAAVAYQDALYKAVKNSPRLETRPVYNLTSWPELIGKFDVYNAHTYPPKGEQPEAAVRTIVEHLRELDHGSSAAITEVGYYTLPGKGTWGGVDEATQASLSLNLILDAIDSGIVKIYLYQLLDAYPDPSSSEMENHFGLFDVGYRPKPAASAIRNLINTVSTGDRETSSAKGQAPSLTLSSGDLKVKSLLVTGDGTSSTLIVWDERKIWDSEKNVPVPVPAVDVTVESDRAFSKVDIIDPTKAAEPIQTLGKGQSVTVALEGHPILIKFRGE
ncbi:hypothetical protein MKK69_22400 [Methylobacterium sp. J-026]|uniref:hypothetical protein n=1 Tax=Methylobacterium sp. J-026 TaxID=2836624 RepID=UPI001FBB2E72|nr:hypothetical protein [Methylobacterium sp. J-026]MCJ2136765.1 hypothetical protein [Methylobacterium sp. J-026]